MHSSRPRRDKLTSLRKQCAPLLAIELCISFVKRITIYKLHSEDSESPRDKFIMQAVSERIEQAYKTMKYGNIHSESTKYPCNLLLCLTVVIEQIPVEKKA